MASSGGAWGRKLCLGTDYVYWVMPWYCGDSLVVGFEVSALSISRPMDQSEDKDARSIWLVEPVLTLYRGRRTPNQILRL